MFRQTSQISNPCTIFDIPNVTPMGLEPITRGLKDRYSSQLSYEVIINSAEEVGVEPTRVVSS